MMMQVDLDDQIGRWKKRSLEWKIEGYFSERRGSKQSYTLQRERGGKVYSSWKLGMKEKKGLEPCERTIEVTYVRGVTKERPIMG